ncbi:sugar phosphate isomerase/epimerase family protein [Actinomycetes bacterium M1A6_2h]
MTAVEHFQSMWAMEDLPFGGPTPWTLAEQVAAIADAGYHGLAVDLGAKQAATADAIGPLARERGLKTAVFAFVGTEAELDSALHYAAEIDATRMVLCARVFDVGPSEAGAIVSAWFHRAADAGVTLELETHRNTVTNDLRFTSHLLDHLDPDVCLAVDLSHFVCANEFPDKPEPEIERHIDLILSRAGSLQGRIATRCQVQVPLGYPQHADWEARFRAWWRTGFAYIRARGNTPMFCTELGPRPYAWTDRHGAEVSDRWAEALTLKQWAEEISS